MKLFFVMTAMIFTMGVSASTSDSCLFDLEIGQECELGFDSITVINVIMNNNDDMKELTMGRKLTNVIVTKEKFESETYSDKTVFTFEAGVCSVMLPTCIDKAKLVIKRYYNKLMMDDVVYTYESSGVIAE